VGGLLKNIQGIKGVAQRKHIAYIEIGKSIVKSNNVTDDMNQKYTESNSLIQGTIQRLGDVLSANSSYWCYLIIFIFIIFFILYKLV
jgi:hypothetical protein